MVANVEHLPVPGETITASSFFTCNGGKGANQAVAAARLGAEVSMVGKLGNDAYGSMYIESLKGININCDCIGIEKDISSGIALIEVDKESENRIIIIPGANKKVTIDFIKEVWDKIIVNDIFLLQLEIPIDTVIYTIKRLKEAGKTVILDPAPAVKLPDDIFGYIDYITPNETELQVVAGIDGAGGASGSFLETAGTLIGKGAKCIIFKAGKNGAYIINKDGHKHIPGFKVVPVDTTGAGDSFNAGFAFALAKGMELEECVRFANAVGALSTTAAGAQSAMPSYDEVVGFMNKI